MRVAVDVLVAHSGGHEAHGTQQQRVQGAKAVLVDVLVAQVEQSYIGKQNCRCGNGAGAVAVEDGGVEVR